MNKTQLVEAIAAEAGLSKTDARKALDAFVKVTGEVLCRGEKVSITGFGSFVLMTRPARTGRNPRTGASVVIPSKKVCRFRPGAELASATE